jgi:hypothetical protein
MNNTLILKYFLLFWGLSILGIPVIFANQIIYKPGDATTCSNASWRKDSNFRANGAVVSANGKQYLKLTFSGSGNGIGVNETKLKTPIIATGKGEYISGFYFDVGYTGEADVEWTILFAFKNFKQKELRYSINLKPGFRVYSIKTAQNIDWSQCSSIRFYLYHSRIKSKTYPTIYLGKISTKINFKTTSLTSQDMRPIGHRIILVENNNPVAVAILPEDKVGKNNAIQALRLLEHKFKVKFKTTTEKNVGVNPKPGNYILFNSGSFKDLSLRMAENSLISRLAKGYEIRTITNCLGNNANFLYIGATNGIELKQAVNKLIASGKLQDDIQDYVDISPPAKSAEEYLQRANELFKLFKQIYSSGKEEKENLKAFVQLRQIAANYYATYDPRILKIFCDAMKILSQNYEKSKMQLRPVVRVESFNFPKLITAASLVDGAPQLSQDQRLMIANMILKVSFDLMNFWEMEKPLALYAMKENAFVENHPMFAIRAILMASDYLLIRFKIPQVEVFRKVALHGFKGIDLMVQQPEDASGYQFISRMHWWEISRKLGLDYFTPNLKQYIEFVIGSVNHMGYSGSYGDHPSLKGGYGWNFLLTGAEHYNDPLCKYLFMKQYNNSSWLKTRLGAIKFDIPVNFPKRQLGVKVFPMDDMLKKYYHASHLNKKATLNKAFFRSGYQLYDNYMSYGGMNSTDPHSHRDANAVLQYVRGRHHWLVDCDYYFRMPYSQNSISIACNNRVTAQSRPMTLQRSSFSEIEDQYNSKDKSMAIFASSLNDYGGTKWIRNIFWHKELGFWCLDEIDALQNADYVIKKYWNTIGEVKKNNNIFEITQKDTGDTRVPNKLYIERGQNGVNALSIFSTFSHNSNGTNFRKYEYAGPDTKIITEAVDKQLRKGEKVYIVDRFTHQKPKNTFRQIQNQPAWISAAPEPQLIALRNLKTQQINFKGKRLFITGKKLMATGVKFLSINGQKWDIPANGKLFVTNVENAGETLKAIYQSCSSPQSQHYTNIKVPEIKNVTQIKLKQTVSAIAVAENKIAVGTAAGQIKLYDLAGKLLWSRVVAPSSWVTKLISVFKTNKICWAVGTKNIDYKKDTAYVALFDNAGNKIWLHEFKKFGKMGGYVNALGRAKIKTSNDSQIVVGLKNRRVIALDANGKRLWTKSIFHSSSPFLGIMDMNNDGSDDISVAETWRTNRIFGANGKELQQTIRTIGQPHSVLMTDINNIPTAIWGLDDSFICGINLKKKYGYSWKINVGGVATGILEMPDDKIAVANKNNRIEFFTKTNPPKSTGKFIKLPSAALKMIGVKNKLYVMCADSFLYEIVNQKITAKFKIKNFIESSDKVVSLISYKNTAVLGYDNAIYIWPVQ